MGSHGKGGQSEKRDWKGEDGNAYQLGGFSFDDELLLLQVLRVRRVVSMRSFR
jgi:hypothetical protein